MHTFYYTMKRAPCQLKAGKGAKKLPETGNKPLFFPSYLQMDFEEAVMPKTSHRILYFLMQSYMNTLKDGTSLPNAWIFIGLVAAFIILSFFTHLEQYKTTYGLVYKEVKDTRISLAERLRRLPLGYFGTQT